MRNWIICTLGISLAPAFVADFPPDAHKFNQRTFHVRLINLCASDKKSSHKIRHKETPRVHLYIMEEKGYECDCSVKSYLRCHRGSRQ